MAAVTEQVADDLNLPVKERRAGPERRRGRPGRRRRPARRRARPTGEGIAAGGDLIVEVDGKAVKGPDDVADAIAGKKPGDEVTVEYYRGDDKKSAKVKLGKRPTTLQQSASHRQTPDFRS